MEFVQYYPIVLDEPGLPSVMIYPPYPPEARLLGPMGDDLLAKHDLGDINQAIVRKRDAFAAMIVEESSAGPVRMDLRAVPQSRWAVHPLSLLVRCRFDFRTTPVRITLGAHFFMGGVRTDADGQTALAGLFACGEIVWGLHGANRMGGNALMECLVSGRIAGRGAAGHALAAPTRSADTIAPEPPGMVEGARPADLRGLRQRIRDAAWRYAGVVRSGEGMIEGLAEVERIRAAIETASATAPQERTHREDLRSAAFVLQAVLAAGLARRESRGTFIRTDWPAEDDANWLKNSRFELGSLPPAVQSGAYPRKRRVKEAPPPIRSAGTLNPRAGHAHSFPAERETPLTYVDSGEECDPAGPEGGMEIGHKQSGRAEVS